jgi:hypothetical protein
MKVIINGIAALLFAAGAAPASACDATLLSAFPDVAEIAKCVASHETGIRLERQNVDKLMALHEKLASLVYRQQEEIAKLSQEVFELKTTLAIRGTKKGDAAR